MKKRIVSHSERETFAFAKADYNGVHRTADEVHAMALANLQGEYATIVSAAELQNAL